MAWSSCAARSTARSRSPNSRNVYAAHPECEASRTSCIRTESPRPTNSAPTTSAGLRIDEDAFGDAEDAERLQDVQCVGDLRRGHAARQFEGADRRGLQVAGEHREIGIALPWRLVVAHAARIVDV